VIAAGPLYRPPLKPQNFDAWRRCEHLAEGVHPVTGLLRRTDAAVAELVELIEVGQLDLELQRGAAALPTGQRHQQPGVQTLAARRFGLAADELDRRWRLTGSTS